MSGSQPVQVEFDFGPQTEPSGSPREGVRPMTAAEIVRDFVLKPDDLVIHTGACGVEVLSGLRELGCRVLRLDPNANGWEGDIDTLRVALTPAVERLVHARYGPLALIIADGVVMRCALRERRTA